MLTLSLEREIDRCVLLITIHLLQKRKKKKNRRQVNYKVAEAEVKLMRVQLIFKWRLKLPLVSLLTSDEFLHPIPITNLTRTTIDGLLFAKCSCILKRLKIFFFFQFIPLFFYFSYFFSFNLILFYFLQFHPPALLTII